MENVANAGTSPHGEEASGQFVEYRCSASMGVAPFCPAGSSADRIIKRADDAR